MLLLRPDLPLIFFRGEVVLMRQPPFNVELIALRHMRTVGTNSRKKSRADHGGLPPPPKCGPRTATVKIFFPKTQHTKHYEKLGKVTDIGDPNFNAERASLDKFAVGWVGF